MCGIAGAFAYRFDAPNIESEEIVVIRDAMEKRGPDGAGLWLSNDKRVAMAHRRLAIIDTSETGAQPMGTMDGGLVVTFNGEIYNYRALRKNLEARGYQFRSHSDTEVLLHLYDLHAENMVHELRGMYAFAIWDSRRQRLFLARDPLGIKPVYYSDDGGTIRFASQVKALLKSRNVNPSEDPRGYVGLCLWGSVPEPFTLYQGISALGAGETLTIARDSGLTAARYYSIAQEALKAENSSSGKNLSLEELREALLDSISHHFVSDVPVGIFQSAGLDSSTITALSSTIQKRKLLTVTLGFPEYEGGPSDEVPIAAQVANAYGAEHRVGKISREEFHTDLRALLEAMDQPSIDGVNTYFVSKLAAQRGLKVALSGLGADELFAGYDGFRQVPRLVNSLKRLPMVGRLGSMVRMLSHPLIRRVSSPKYAGVLEFGGTYGGAYLLRRSVFMPWELERFFPQRFIQEGLEALQPVDRLNHLIEGLRSDRLKMTVLEVSAYLRNQLLRDADWAGMAHSLEIRVPFVDVELYRRLLPALAGSAPPSKIAMATTPPQPLPPSVLNRPKSGFSVPVRDWILEMAGASARDRGLRGWLRLVCPALQASNNLLVLLTDGFGLAGGIAKFNQDFLTAACSARSVREVRAIPRNDRTSTGNRMPQRLTWITSGIGGKLRYVLAAVWNGCIQRTDLVVCGHINLLPLAWLLSRIRRAPLAAVIHGLDSWRPNKSKLVNALARQADAYISVSEFTWGRFSAWSRADRRKCFILPNCVDLKTFRPIPTSEDLLNRWGLKGTRVLMTLARLDPTERYKGIDEVLEAMPRLLKRNGQLRYVIAGAGGDSQRLQAKALTLGIGHAVVFTGFIPEEEKVRLYSLADVFVMPSRVEGFGIVLIEALACGIPVVGSKVDGSQEALQGGRLGALVDPDSEDEIVDAIEKGLRLNRGVTSELDSFSYDVFSRRAVSLLESVITHKSSNRHSV